MELSRRTFFKGLVALAATKTIEYTPIAQVYKVTVTQASFTGDHLYRFEIWSRELKRMLMADLDAMRFTDEH